MANIQTIINSLRVIAAAPYQGRAQSRKSLHQINFEKLQGAASTVANILEQNNPPSGDTIENLAAQFDSMKAEVEGYCSKTEGAEDVLRAFSKASAEWDLVMRGL
jgi:ABC-type transporter Mla subunit MlaD